MNTVRLVKSFNKGQITIPKEFRDAFGIKDEFWMRLSLAGRKIIAEFVDKGKSKGEYAQKLLAIKGDWFSLRELENNRKEIQTRIQR